MLLTDMDVGKTVLGEESEAVTRWAWRVIPLEKQNGKNNHAWSETQVFILLYSDILSELVRQGEQCSCFLIHGWKKTSLTSAALQTANVTLFLKQNNLSQCMTISLALSSKTMTPGLSDYYDNFTNAHLWTNHVVCSIKLRHSIICKVAGFRWDGCWLQK